MCTNKAYESVVALHFGIGKGDKKRKFEYLERSAVCVFQNPQHMPECFYKNKSALSAQDVGTSDIYVSSSLYDLSDEEITISEI